MPNYRFQGSRPETKICQFALPGSEDEERRFPFIEVDGQGGNLQCLRRINDSTRGSILESLITGNRVPPNQCLYLREEGLCPLQIDQESKPPRN